MIKNIFKIMIFVVLALGLYNGCSVFNTVGHSISQSYTNTASYFNYYYNAKWLFDEAEDEIKLDQLAMRGKENITKSIPHTAKEKLNKAIDKCSNILAFFPTSTVVDDALLLIGKSYYYQNEFLKAERKFAELIAQYPDSPLLLENNLWFARTLEKLDKNYEAIEISITLIAKSQANNDIKIEYQARELLGILYVKTKQTEKSIAEYEREFSLATDDKTKVDALLNIGNIYFNNQKYEKALEYFSRVQSYNPDVYSNYISNYKKTISLRMLKNYEKALQTINALIEDFWNKEYMASMLYERANIFLDSEKLDDATIDYAYVDTAYNNTEYSFLSAHKLGYLNEIFTGDYLQALNYYKKSSRAIKIKEAADDYKKVNAINRYFSAYKNLQIADSIFSIITDTNLVKYTSNVKINDTSKNSIQANQDSLQINNDTINKIDITKLPSEDSLKVIKSIAANELGDIFYSDLNVPDSAIYWFNQSLKWNYKSEHAPRILYILAQMAPNHTKLLDNQEEYYKRIEKDFPNTLYADKARQYLKKNINIDKKDIAEESYIQAEKLIEEKQYFKAIASLQKTARIYSTSEYAAKSEYTIGWIYENKLSNYDSALVQYKRVAEKYAGTVYANAVINKIENQNNAQEDVKIPTDTVKNNTTIENTSEENSSKTNLPDSTNIDIRENGEIGEPEFIPPADTSKTYDK